MITWLTIIALALAAAGLWWLSRRRHQSTGVHRTPNPYSAPTDVVEAVQHHEAQQASYPETRAYGVVRPDHMQPNELGGGIPSMWAPPKHYRDETAEMPAVNATPRHADDA